MSCVDALIKEREALAFGALGYFTALRRNEKVPEYVRAEAQRIEDEWNRLSAEIDAEFVIGTAQRAVA